MPSIKIDEKAELYLHSAIHEFGCCVTNNIPTYFSIVILNGKYGKYSRKEKNKGRMGRREGHSRKYSIFH